MRRRRSKLRSANKKRGRREGPSSNRLRLWSETLPPWIKTLSRRRLPPSRPGSRQHVCSLMVARWKVILLPAFPGMTRHCPPHTVSLLPLAPPHPFAVSQSFLATSPHVGRAVAAVVVGSAAAAVAVPAAATANAATAETPGTGRSSTVTKGVVVVILGAGAGTSAAVGRTAGTTRAVFAKAR